MTTVEVLVILYCNYLLVVGVPSEDSRLLKDRHSALLSYPILATVCGIYTVSEKA